MLVSDRSITDSSFDSKSSTVVADDLSPKKSEKVYESQEESSAVIQTNWCRKFLEEARLNDDWESFVSLEFRMFIETQDSNSSVLKEANEVKSKFYVPY